MIAYFYTLNLRTFGKNINQRTKLQFIIRSYKSPLLNISVVQMWLLYEENIAKIQNFFSLRENNCYNNQKIPNYLFFQNRLYKTWHQRQISNSFMKQTDMEYTVLQRLYHKQREILQKAAFYETSKTFLFIRVNKNFRQF